MEEIKFDFNNMFSSIVGEKHGVSEADLNEVLPGAKEAHKHLKALMQDEAVRLTLGLEWMKLPFQDKKQVVEIQKLGDEVAAKYENVIFLGIGGSYLGLKAAQDALCVPYYNEFVSLRKKRPRIYFEGNNLDPDTLSALLKNLNPGKTFVVVISKSGQTTETRAGFMIVEDWLKKRLGAKYGRQIFVITDPQSGELRQKAQKAQKKDKLAFRSLSLLKGVGGRFSELNMGLLHLAVAGISAEEVLRGARDMAERCSSDDILKNPAYMYAILHTVLYRKKGKSIVVMFPFSEGLKSTADWYVQLLAESLGKKFARRIEHSQQGTEEWARDESRVLNIGRTPISARGTNDLHSIQQNNIEGENNKAVTFIKVERFKSDLQVQAGEDILSSRRFSNLIKLAQEATEWALIQEGRPNCTIIMPEVNPYYWGALLFFFEVSTAFEGELLGVNAFDQPGVEGYKNYMYYKLGKSGIPQAAAEAIEKKPLRKDPSLIL